MRNLNRIRPAPDFLQALNGAKESSRRAVSGVFFAGFYSGVFVGAGLATLVLIWVVS